MGRVRLVQLAVVSISTSLAISGLSSQRAQAADPEHFRAAYDAAVTLTNKTPQYEGGTLVYRTTLAPFALAGPSHVQGGGVYDNAVSSCLFLDAYPLRRWLRSRDGWVIANTRIAVDANDRRPSQMRIAAVLDPERTSTASRRWGVARELVWTGYLESGFESKELSREFEMNYSCDDVVKRQLALGVFVKTASGGLKPFAVTHQGKQTQLVAPLRGLTQAPSPTTLASVLTWAQRDQANATAPKDGPTRAYADINVGSKGLRAIRDKELVIAVVAKASVLSPYLGLKKLTKDSELTATYYVPSATNRKQTLDSYRQERSIKKRPNRARLTLIANASK